MVRLLMNMGEQTKFFRQVAGELGLSSVSIGKLLGISGRSYRDWVNGKVLPRKESVNLLHKLSGVAVPKIIEEREEWWSGRINGKSAGIARVLKHGSPGTPEGRRKGGRVSQLRRKEAPDIYRKMGCKVANDFITPRHSCTLAEFVGIVLGDGSISKDQCQISLHMIDDIEYAKHVGKLASKLFGANHSESRYPKDNALKIVISGVKFVKSLELFGLQKGNKIKHQVDIPRWIKNNPDYLKACIRGLFDTDGGTFTHRHVVNGHRYVHFGLTFTSASKPLLNSYKRELDRNGFGIHGSGDSTFIYGVKETKRFFDIFKPRNRKHKERFLNYLSSRNRLGKLEYAN